MDASGAPASAGYANWPRTDFREAHASQGAETAKRWKVDAVIAFTLHVIGLHDDNSPDEVKEESMENDRVDGAVWIRTRTREEKRFVRRHRLPNASDLFSIADSSLLKQIS